MNEETDESIKPDWLKVLGKLDHVFFVVGYVSLVFWALYYLVRGG